MASKVDLFWRTSEISIDSFRMPSPRHVFFCTSWSVIAVGAKGQLLFLAFETISDLNRAGNISNHFVGNLTSVPQVNLFQNQTSGYITTCWC